MAARPRLILLGVMLSIFLGAMESTVVATAMPKVVGSLGGIELYSWVISGFLLTSTVTMPLWGRLSDLFGRRPTYLTGLAIFLAGSALSGLSRNMVELIVFRMLQGLGAGSLITIGMTIVGELFRLERRAKAQGYISGIWGVASLLGPLLGGVLTDYVSWRWVFYINLPFGAIAMGLLAANLRDEGERRRPVIDYAGVALFAAGVSALLLGVGEAGRSARWTGPEVLLLLGAAAAVLAGFVLVEGRAPEAIVPLRLFRDRMVVAAVLTGFLSGTAMFGAISFVPLFLQHVRSFSATATGWALIPFVFGWTGMSVATARLVLRIGYRLPVVVGMACLTVAFLLLSGWDQTLTLGVAMRDAFLAGAGMGMTMVPMLIAVQSAVPPEDLGVATSMTQFFRAVGGAIGVSVMGAVMAQRLSAGLPMVDALHGVFVTGLAVCGLAFLAAFLVPAGRAQELARDVHAEPTRVAGGSHGR
ncbi:MAG: MFS transporter [Candidatus Rokubacteria bacterium]|nr:MFS transporter [Candidatus Rokubacteria bacterium]MBI3826993.1 MFS transporter [Candidatus Rokubacteria bacterium]